MQNKGLLYWILNSDKQPLYINASGNIEAGSGVFQSDGVTPAHLQFSPDGWNDTLVKWGRNIKYIGLFREFSIPLNFVGDGAKILRDAFWKNGMEAVLYISISKLNRTAFPDKYDQWYTGELDFSKFKQTLTGVDINIMEGGLSKLLKANEATTYDISVSSDAEKIVTYLDGLPFTNKVESIIFEQDLISSQYILGTGIISNEGTTQGVISGDQQQGASAPSSDNQFFKSVTKNVNLNISGTVILSNSTATINVKTFIQKHDLNGVFIAEYVIVPYQFLTFGTILSVPYSLTIPVEPKTKLTLYQIVGGVVDTCKVKGFLNWNYEVTFDSTLCEGLTWFRLFELLTYKLTNGKFGCKSDFLRSLTDQCITSGQLLRKYKDLVNVQVIKTSFNDFFKACQRWGVGLGIVNNQLVIEKYEYFFNNELIIDLGQITDCEFTEAEDLQINTIKTGYSNQTYDNVNGKYEFNVTQQYTTPHTRIVKEMDLICPYRADMYGIELTRLKLFQKDTTDNKADNDTFLINITKGISYNYYKGNFETKVNAGLYYVSIPSILFQLVNGSIINFASTSYKIINTSYLIDGFTTIQVLQTVTNAAYNTIISVIDSSVYHLNRPAYSAITGIIHAAESFNTELTPKHALLNNGAFLHSLLDKQDSKFVVFQSGEKNSELSTTLSGVTVTQKADVQIYNLPAKLFIPYYASFKTKVTIDLPAIMKANSYGIVSFTWQGKVIKGFIWDNGMAPATDDSQTWKLLLTNDNNTLNLI